MKSKSKSGAQKKPPRKNSDNVPASAKPKRILKWTTWAPSPIIGVDEVGRGCLAGPVYAGAVILNLDFRHRHFLDSKILSAQRREELASEILAHHWVGIGFATVEEIDEINILQASFLAMARAIEELTDQVAARSISGMEFRTSVDTKKQFAKAHVIVDGHMRVRGLPSHFIQTPIVDGDQRVAPVSAASIVAKVARDQFMKDLVGQFPQYGFEAHKGYGTKQHQAALKEWGPCPFHRRSFRGVIPSEQMSESLAP